MKLGKKMKKIQCNKRWIRLKTKGFSFIGVYKVEEDGMSSKSLEKKSGKNAFKNMMKLLAVIFRLPVRLVLKYLN